MILERKVWPNIHMLLFIVPGNVVIQTLLISLVSFPHGGLVDGVPIISSGQDNIIEGQNKTETINATSIGIDNDLHERPTKLPRDNSTTGYPTTKTLHVTLKWDKKKSGTNINIVNTSSSASLPTTAPPRSISLISSTKTPSVKHKVHPFQMKILEYVLIPVGFVLMLIISYCLVRHIQRVRRKRRLERELLHQYSYPNSEADDMENEQNITEIDSIVNTQFVAYNDHNDKILSDDIPQVTVTIGGVPKPAVKQDTEDLEQSTSFND